MKRDVNESLTSNFDHIYTLLAVQFEGEQDGPAQVFFILASVMSAFLSQMNVDKKTMMRLLDKIIVMTDEMKD